ncbi:OLC1v1016492C1 [Oldenlandia corymbosa var. corymbosa]|uniref:OLC1v1016492C1 n=1 Tax=Oldenlandia corymbosa var. corymbosa TaxID=529605 RepID=A0AAV1E738_OLDCO|nr:OLC1v1016492C1 [Oldenlandia corymbosa var. corymbosa]
MLEPRNESESEQSNIFDPFKSIHDEKGYQSLVNSGAGARITADWNINSDGGVQFMPLRNSSEDDETGEIHSPPLWQSSPPHRSSSQYQNYNNFRSLSPASRTQAIVRGQRELMEMVKNMPESSYELSLKDLVEHHHRQLVPRIMGSPKEESCLLDDHDDEAREEQVLKQRQRSIRRQESNNNEKKTAKFLRSGSLVENRGLFLKMVFPVSFKSSKKKNLVTQNSTISSRVSPKPEISSSDKPSNSRNCSVDKEWWKKRFAGSSGSDITNSSNSGSTGSSGSSSSIHSHSSNGRKKMGFLRSCFSCFYGTRSQAD